jgi:predicted N-formylglutamate amidohydrolase
MSSRPDDRPFLSVTPGALAPVVLTCEHASNRLPRPLRATRRERELLRSHWGWDIGAWDLTRELARRLSTSAVGGRWSRLVIDLNRRVDEASLIHREIEGVELSWNRDLTPGEVERRMLEFHAPYHLEIDREILRRAARGVRPLLFAVHSFTPVHNGRSRPFEIGILFDRHPRLAHRLARTLRRHGLSVRYNEPYSGKLGLMYSADRHGTHHGLPCLELEVNQGLFEDPRTVTRIGGAVAEGVRDLCERLAGGR